MALITSANYKDYAGISDTSFDAFLAVAVPAVQDTIESLCGRSAGGFESASWTETFSGAETPCKYLRNWPVTAIASVSFVDADGTSSTLDSSRYAIDPSGRAVCMTGSMMGRALMATDGSFEGYFAPNQTGVRPQFLEGMKNYTVTYTGGYAAVPSRLKWVCYRMIDQMIADRRVPGDLKSESIGDYSYTKEAAAGLISQEVRDRLQEWIVSVA
jgi:hypothetical protein